MIAAASIFAKMGYRAQACGGAGIELTEGEGFIDENWGG